jgi:hypothetical protein
MEELAEVRGERRWEVGVEGEVKRQDGFPN